MPVEFLFRSNVGIRKPQRGIYGDVVNRTEDVYLRCNQFIETVVGVLNLGFPFSESLLQCRQGRTRMDEWVVLQICVRCMQCLWLWVCLRETWTVVETFLNTR